VNAALTRYRILANTVGVLLIPLVLFAWPRHILYTEGSQVYEMGEWVNTYLGPLHGFIYMIFLVFAFLLSRKAEWSLPFTATTLLLGTVPVLSFWAEHRATEDVRATMAAADTPARAGEPGIHTS
jgi:integral membrane protein